MKSTLSSKGQITVPIEIRESMGLRPGTPVVFERRPEGALLRKATRSDHPVDRAYGSLPLGTSVDRLLDEMRGARPSVPRRARRSR